MRTRCAMRNGCSVMHNWEEARTTFTGETSGLDHSVTGRRAPRGTRRPPGARPRKGRGRAAEGYGSVGSGLRSGEGAGRSELLAGRLLDGLQVGVGVLPDRDPQGVGASEATIASTPSAKSSGRPYSSLSSMARNPPSISPVASA